MRKKAVIAMLVGALVIISSVAMYAKVNDVNQDDGSIDSLSSLLQPENREYGKPISTYTYDIQNDQVDFYLYVNQDESNDSLSGLLQPENREYGKPISTYTYDIQNDQVDFYLYANQDESNDSLSNLLQPENREYGNPISTYTYTK